MKILISSIMLIFIGISYLIIKKLKNASLQISILRGYNKNLATANDNLRCFKHDFNNIIQAIYGYIILNDLESLKNYFNKLLEECNNISIAETLTPTTINNPALYSILINKYQIAEKFNIKMNIDVLLDFEFVRKNIYDISRMFGILLDNAIEAAKECEEKLINIQFAKENENKCLIIIENTYNDTSIDIEKLFQKNYTTKKWNENSGLGLWEVKKRLIKNTNLDLYTTKNSKMFKQQLEIYNNIDNTFKVKKEAHI